MDFTLGKMKRRPTAGRATKKRLSASAISRLRNRVDDDDGLASDKRAGEANLREWVLHMSRKRLWFMIDQGTFMVSRRRFSAF